MDRASILSHLQAAERRVATSERRVVSQCKLIWSLQRAGEDTTSAIAVLREIEERQLGYLADRDRLLAELGLAEAQEAANANASAMSESREPKLRKRTRSRRMPLAPSRS